MPHLKRKTRAHGANPESVPSAGPDNTLIAYLRYLCPHESFRRSPKWPPDLFALAGALLLHSGGYRTAMSDWPPVPFWKKRIERNATDWRRRWNKGRTPPPEVHALWREVLKFRDLELNRISEYRNLCIALLELCAIADETSYSLGIPTSRASDFDKFYAHAAELLNDESGATLCENIHSSKARVLPKMHTPQTGLTFRSFSLHLALYMSNEMVPHWYTVPSRPEKHKLKLLLLPWPLIVKRAWFRKAAGTITMPTKYGFFEYAPDDDDGIVGRAADVFERAVKKVGRIDGVIFPELALTQAQYLRISNIVLSKSTFLIAGVGSVGKSGSSRRNRVHFDVPLPNEYHVVRLRQAKHHRWRLDGSQISRYRLNSRLGTKKLLWENIELEDRYLNFVTLRPWLTISVLICEDLARPDPVGDLIRAVGPNLVVSLLLDGPQLPYRWSSRYAAALADDPGCSVLTLTSLGMTELSCPSGKKDKGHRVVALWRDGGSGESKPIKVPAIAQGIVLTVNVEEKTEFTADGRSDYGATGYPILERYDFV